MVKSNSAQYDNLGAHLPIWAGDNFVGVLTFEDYPNPVHFGVLEPILSTAVMMLAENLQWTSEAVAALQEEMSQLGNPKAAAADGNNPAAQQGQSGESNDRSKAAPEPDQTLKIRRQGA
jgi:hypothetical protein